MRIKEQETRLTLHKHDDDNDDDKKGGFFACNPAHLTAQFLAYDDWMAVNSEMERHTKHVPVLCFNALSSEFPVGTNPRITLPLFAVADNYRVTSMTA